MKIIQINSVRNYKYQLRAPSSSDTLVSAAAAAAFICGEDGGGGRQGVKNTQKEERCSNNRPGSGHQAGGVTTCS